MSIVPHIEVDDAEVQAAFRRLVETGENPASYMPAIGAAMAKSTRLRFIAGQAPDGSRWKAVLRGGVPLRDKGAHLMNHISYRAEGASVTWGVPYLWARVHQFGATILAKNAPYLRFKIGNRWARKKSVTIPARPFLGISAEDRMEVLAILRDRIGGEGVSA